MITDVVVGICLAISFLAQELLTLVVSIGVILGALSLIMLGIAKAIGWGADLHQHISRSVKFRRRGRRDDAEEDAAV